MQEAFQYIIDLGRLACIPLFRKSLDMMITTAHILITYEGLDGEKLEGTLQFIIYIGMCNVRTLVKTDRE